MKGQTLVEYTLIVLAVAIAAFGTYRVMGNRIASFTNPAAVELSNA